LELVPEKYVPFSAKNGHRLVSDTSRAAAQRLAVTETTGGRPCPGRQCEAVMFPELKTPGN